MNISSSQQWGECYARACRSRAKRKLFPSNPLMPSCWRCCLPFPSPFIPTLFVNPTLFLRPSFQILHTHQILEAAPDRKLRDHTLARADDTQGTPTPSHMSPSVVDIRRQHARPARPRQRASSLFRPLIPTFILVPTP